MRFAYTRRGGPLLSWSGPSPPAQTRAGETRSLGAFYSTSRTSSALRRYGGRGPRFAGSAAPYQNDRTLGSYGGTVCLTMNSGSSPVITTMPTQALSGVNLPRPGAPEVVEGYEPPQPGAAVVQIGEDCTWDIAHRRSHGMSGFIPEGAARNYGNTALADDPEPAPATQPAFDTGALVRRASVVAAAYHGVRRNRGSLFWGLVWAAAAYVMPADGALVPAFALAQGYGQAKPCP